MCSYGLFITSSSAFDDQRHVGQLCVCVCACVVCVCLSAFQGALWAAIRGEQEAHHCGRKENPSSGGLVEGRLERQQWVVGEVLEDSWGGRRTVLEKPLQISKESLGLTFTGCRYVIMRLVAACANLCKSTLPLTRSSQCWYSHCIRMLLFLVLRLWHVCILCCDTTVSKDQVAPRVTGSVMDTHRRSCTMPRAWLVHHPLYLFPATSDVARL